MKQIKTPLEFKEKFIYRVNFSGAFLIVLCLKNESTQTHTLVKFKTLKGDKKEVFGKYLVCIQMK